MLNFAKVTFWGRHLCIAPYSICGKYLKKNHSFEKCYHQHFINYVSHIAEKEIAFYSLFWVKRISQTFVLLQDKSRFSCTKILAWLENRSATNISFHLQEKNWCPPLLHRLCNMQYVAIPIRGQTQRKLLLSCISSLFCQIRYLNLDEMTAGSLSFSIVLLFRGVSYQKIWLKWLYFL